MKIGMTGVFVNDPIQAFKFYTEVLGFIKKVYIPEALLAIVASPEQPDGTSLLLEPNDNPIAKAYQEGIYNSGIPVITFTVSDVYKEFERLRDLRVVFRKEPEKTDYGIEALFEDTCGNLIQLFQA
jgi:catechol 2,3-dioxygenase-like lactoylglutathione lyase family enzyme